MLDADGEPRPEPDLLVWAHWFERTARTGERVIARDRDESGRSPVMVSTVFLALDHNFRNSGPPILWETLVFGGVLDGEMCRYSSRAAALEGHQAMCARVRAAEEHQR